jgi:sporulation protein YlmC with PRC-barrel domain
VSHRLPPRRNHEDYEQLKELSGHKVVSADGEQVGYIDLIFRDIDTGALEWLGIWDGLPDTKPRVLVPVGASTSRPMS